MHLDGAFRQPERLADVAVTQAARGEVRHFGFARRERPCRSGAHFAFRHFGDDSREGIIINSLLAGSDIFNTFGDAVGDKLLKHQTIGTIAAPSLVSAWTSKAAPAKAEATGPE